MEIDYSLSNNLKDFFEEFSKENLCVLFADKGIFYGTFLLFVMFSFFILTFPFLFIGALNQASKKWFLHKDRTQ